MLTLFLTCHLWHFHLGMVAIKYGTIQGECKHIKNVFQKINHVLIHSGLSLIVLMITAYQIICP